MVLQSISILKSRAKLKREFEEVILQNKPNELLQKSAKKPSDKQLLNGLYTTKSHLETVMRPKTKGNIIRSKARWREQGCNTGGGGGGVWVIWYRHEFFVNPLIPHEFFFLGVCACKIFFSPSNVLHEIFLGCGWG